MIDLLLITPYGGPYHKLHIKPREMINRSHFSYYHVPKYMYTCVSNAVSEAEVLASQIQDSSCSPTICGAQVLLLSTIFSFLNMIQQYFYHI